MTNEIEIKNYLAEVNNDYKMLADTIDAIEVRNEADMENAGAFRKKVDFFVKKIEEKRKETVQPLNDRVKEINTAVKRVSPLFKELLSKLDDKIKPFLLEVERARQESAARWKAAELAKIEAEQKAMEAQAAEIDTPELLDIAVNIEAEKQALAEKVIKVKKSITTAEAGTGLRDNWQPVIIDADSVPREYCSPDTAKIKEYLKTHKKDIIEGKAAIPGVRFENKISIQSR